MPVELSIWPIREVTESDIGCESAGWLWRHLSLSFAGCLLLRQWTLLPKWLHLWWFRNVQVWRCDLSISNKDPQFAQQGLWYRVSWLVYMSWWHDLLSHGWRNIRVLSIPSGKYLECHISPILLLHVCYAISDMPFVSICFVKQVHVRCDKKWILLMWIIPRDVLVGIISRPKSTATEIWNIHNWQTSGAMPVELSICQSERSLRVTLDVSRLDGCDDTCHYHLQAVCCSDNEHCCPNGYTCDDSGTCRFGDVTFPSATKILNLHSKVSDIECPDWSTCPDGMTCCPMGGGTYGCCPFPQVNIWNATFHPFYSYMSVMQSAICPLFLYVL